MLKLTRGAGRIIFPLDRENIPFKEHLEPLPETVLEPGWVNVDKFPMPGIGECINLFKFPWLRSSNGSPWNDGSVDEIYAAHILEHIPHTVTVAPDLPLVMHRQYLEWCERMDGFFVFFAECYRILKPDGLVYVRVPFGVSYPAISDPTHTRYITPGSFGYLTNQSDGVAPFDYHLPFKFEQTGEASFRFIGEWSSRIPFYTEKGIHNLLQAHPNVCDEMRIILKAVKEN